MKYGLRIPDDRFQAIDLNARLACMVAQIGAGPARMGAKAGRHFRCGSRAGRVSMSKR